MPQGAAPPAGGGAVTPDHGPCLQLHLCSLAANCGVTAIQPVSMHPAHFKTSLSAGQQVLRPLNGAEPPQSRDFQVEPARETGKLKVLNATEQ